ncbi:MAG: toprim domain-containing protein [Saprospiraceae bacterium]|jgi:hypothetical protein|nr:toprim domain-containing protein [Saprospiraceae bacterium]
MNAKEAKRKIHLPDLMARLGYQPTEIKKGGNEYWYKSPFRKEKTASFHTSFLNGIWIWKDFGDDSHGTVIDFVMRHENYHEPKEALRYLRNIYQHGLFENQKSSAGDLNTGLFSYQQQPIKGVKDSWFERELEFTEAHEIRNSIIFNYLESRGIPKNLANLYLKEVKYRNIKKDKIYFAFGMKNLSGGYEIRSASDQNVFKSALIKRDISIVSNASNNKMTNIFEGMTDFLSFLVLAKYYCLPTDNDAIIMHSLSSFKKTIDYIKQKNYNEINTFLDNDEAGYKYNQKFINQLGDKVKNQSKTFAGFIDLNYKLKSLLTNKQPLKDFSI